VANRRGREINRIKAELLGDELVLEVLKPVGLFSLNRALSLLEKGACTCVRGPLGDDENRFTCLEYAVMNGHWGVVNAIQRARAKAV
jgi:hypothetical protein